MTRGIIVCSISQSQTSNNVVEIIKQLCPGEKVTFQLAQKKTRFDCRKVVFCHSSLEGRLALTDVNDSIYDDAIAQANKIVGKENVTFIVTKVPAGDAKLRRRMITNAQPTLILNIGMLLLVDSVDDITHLDQDNVNKLNKFLNRTAYTTDYTGNVDYTNKQELGPDDRNGGHVSPNSMSVTYFLLLIILLCLAVVYNQQIKQERQIKDFSEQVSGLILLLNNSIIELEKNVQRQAKIIEDEKSSMETKLTEYIKHTENTLQIINDAMANITRRIIVIYGELRSNKYKQNKQKMQEKIITTQQLDKLEKTQENIKIMQSNTDKQLFELVVISADAKQLLQRSKQCESVTRPTPQVDSSNRSKGNSFSSFLSSMWSYIASKS
ncbi:uncharacterized protein LOC117114128 [Anneissia japonica]|uniref:uncharacterized protein LOC117114128 n=1 Tax=Anneissia japonica TaxID=1529436 RepID=UPI0014258A52|nr:uncharacterized protein LOC117114128 [Anneissia japonica]